MEAVKGHLARGVKPVSVNSWLTGVRAYGIWLWKEGHLKEKPRIELLKCEKKILATFGEQHIKALINWKPVGSNQARAHTMGLVALDSGLRVSEMLSLPRQNVDFDNLVLRVQGKGNKQRLVPVSVELRKTLYRHLAKHQHARLFTTRSGTPLTVRNS